MGGILSSLNTSYTGLKTSQVLVDVTGHNISNANNDFYTRQRVVTGNAYPINMGGDYNLGQGTEIITIERIHDEFIFQRYTKAAQEKTFYETEEQALRETSSYFPEIDNIGIYNDLKNYFDSWKNLANKPGDPAQKLVLAQYTETMVHNIRDTRAKLSNLQEKLNGEVKLAVEEINRVGKQIAEINKQIANMETNMVNTKANDLRDRRDQLELSLNELIDLSVFKNNIRSNAVNNIQSADFGDKYTLSIGGNVIVDGASFHPFTVTNENNADGFYSVYYLDQSHKSIDVTSSLKGGKIGALIDLCYSHEQNSSCDGRLGKLQNYIDDLDTFAVGIIQATNNIYAETSQKEMVSDIINIKGDDRVTYAGYNVLPGTFDVVMYNGVGEEMGRKTITINKNTTTMNDIVNAINANDDDNKDGNATNDIDNFFKASFSDETKIFQISSLDPSQGVYLSIQDNGTNFAGTIGLNKYFVGNSARDIDLATRYKEDPTLIRAYRESVDGNFIVANKMQQLQYDKITFFNKSGITEDATLPDFFKKITGRIAAETESVATLKDTKIAVYNSVKLEYSSVSQVSVDEELTNLIKFQAGYQANAKVVTTIDQMINALLGMKQ